jgi:hypothetical protein
MSETSEAEMSVLTDEQRAAFNNWYHPLDDADKLTGYLVDDCELAYAAGIAYTIDHLRQERADAVQAAAKAIEEASRCSETMRCPSVEIMAEIIAREIRGAK